MRLCFHGFCLGQQRPLAVEQSSQTTLSLVTSAFDSYNNSDCHSLELSSKETAHTATNNNIEMIAQESNMNQNFENNEGEISGNSNLDDNQNNNTWIDPVDLIKIELMSTDEKDLIKIIELKNNKIKELEELLNKKNEEIANLRSHLDKFQSVFPFSRKTGGGIGRKIGQSTQRQRATGISAEPQQNSMHDLLNVSFPKYEKQDR